MINHNVPTFSITTVSTAFVRETPVRSGPNAGPQIPVCEIHARRIAREADAWFELATETTRQRPATLRAKALAAACFSVARKASSLAVPTKLSGVRDHQAQLWAMHAEQAAPWSPIDVCDTGDGLALAYGGEPVGEVQAKHTPWVRELLSYGVRVYLSRITGAEREHGWLGINVVIGHVGEAVVARRDAVAGLTPPAAAAVASEAGERSQGAERARRALFGPPAIRLQAERGDGAVGSTDGFRLAVSGSVPTDGIPVGEEHTALASTPDDVVCFRTVTGEARMSIPHLVRHSPTGIDFGPQAGRAGLADFARSVLAHVAPSEAGEETADALATRFVEGIARRMPYRGGVIRAVDVRTWIERTTKGGHAA